MKSKLSIAQKLMNAFEQAGRSRVRNELLVMSDRNLADIGFSRELLLKGNKAWPWRIEESEAEILQPEFKQQQPKEFDFAPDLPNVA